MCRMGSKEKDQLDLQDGDVEHVVFAMTTRVLTATDTEWDVCRD